MDHKMLAASRKEAFPLLGRIFFSFKGGFCRCSAGGSQRKWEELLLGSLESALLPSLNISARVFPIGEKRHQNSRARALLVPFQLLLLDATEVKARAAPVGLVVQAARRTTDASLEFRAAADGRSWHGEMRGPFHRTYVAPKKISENLLSTCKLPIFRIIIVTIQIS